MVANAAFDWKTPFGSLCNKSEDSFQTTSPKTLDAGLAHQTSLNGLTVKPPPTILHPQVPLSHQPYLCGRVEIHGTTTRRTQFYQAELEGVVLMDRSPCPVICLCP